MKKAMPAAASTLAAAIRMSHRLLLDIIVKVDWVASLAADRAPMTMRSISALSSFATSVSAARLFTIDWRFPNSRSRKVNTLPSPIPNASTASVTLRRFGSGYLASVSCSVLSTLVARS